MSSRPSRARRIARSLPVLAVALAAAAYAKTPQYTSQELLTPRGLSIAPSALGPGGDVVGSFKAHPHGVNEASAGILGGRFVEWHALGSSTSTALGVNAGGDVVGAAVVPTGGAWLRTSDGTVTDLLAGTGFAGGSAQAINASRTVVGDYTGPTGATPFIWQGGTLAALPTSSDSYSTYPRAINDAGTIVGLAFDKHSPILHPVEWIGGQLQELPVLGANGGAAQAVSSIGTVAGWTWVGVQIHACTWQNGAIVDLGVPPSQAHSEANGVNAAGDVVGYAKDIAASSQRAMLWRGGEAIDLNKLVDLQQDWLLTDALAINDAGQILVVAKSSRKDSVELLLTPIGQ